MKTHLLTRTIARPGLWTVIILASAIAASAAPVTFQVNMEIQVALGTFDAGSGHTVEVHGSFDGWGPGAVLSMNVSNPNIYEGTTDIAGGTGSEVEYKFVINQVTLVWEGNVGPGGPNGNRVFTLAASPQILPAVYFNNLTSNPGVGIPVTFRVNLGVQIARGLFDPESGTVVVAGPFNNWSTTASPLTNSVDNPSIFTGAVNISRTSPRGSVAHKFVVNGGTWEGGDNRTFTLASSSQILPVEPFDRMPDLGPVGVSVVAPNPFQVTVSWTGGPGIRLQKSTDLNNPWEEVPGSLGQSSVVFDLTFPKDRFSTFYRLVGP